MHKHLKLHYIFCYFLLIQLGLLPAYKLFEVYYDAPNINFAIIRLLFFVTILLLIFFNKIIIENNNINRYFILFYFLITLIIGLNLDRFFIDDIYQNEYLNRIDSVLISYPIYFLAGKYYRQEWRSKLFFGILILNCSIIFCSPYLIQSFIQFDDLKKINYILISDGLLGLTLLYRSFNDKLKWLNILTLISLFLVPSRANFFIFLVLLIYQLRLKLFNLVLFGIISIFCLFTFFDTPINILESLQNSRLNILQLSEDNSSILTRLELFKNFDYQKLFIGDFMIDLDLNNGTRGFETHSYLSLLNQFGLLPFFLVVLLIIKTVQKNIKEKKSPIYEYTFWSISTAIFLKSFLYPFIWFSFGYLNQKKYHER